MQYCKGRQSTSTSGYQSFRFSVPQGIARAQSFQLSVPKGLARTQVISDFGILGSQYVKMTQTRESMNESRPLGLGLLTTFAIPYRNKYSEYRVYDV